MKKFPVLAALCALLVTMRAQAADVVAFPFNEGSGATVTDSISGLVGTFGAPQNPDTDSPLASDESASGAAGDRSFKTQGEGFLMVDDRTNSVLNIASNKFTMETWINIDPNFAGTTEGFGAYGNAYKFGLKGGQLVFTLLGVKDITNTANPIFPVGQWTHVATAWDPGVGVTFYVNGQAYFEPSTNVARAPLHNFLSIGSEGTGNNVIANFDRFRIHNAFLTADQLDSDAANPKAPLPSTVVAYNFNEEAAPYQNATAAVRPAVSSVTMLPLALGPQWITGPSGRADDFALSFDGTRRVIVQDPNRVIVNTADNGDYTLQAWVRLPVGFTPTARMIMYQYEAPPAFAFSINTDRTLHTTAFGKRDQVSSAVVPNDGRWHHVAVVHDDGLEFRFYVDGVLKDTRAYTLGVGVNRNTPVMTIGMASSGANGFRGDLDRIRFSNHAVAANELDYPAIPGFPMITSEPTGTNVVAGATVQLTGSANGAAPLNYQWKFSATGNIADATNIPGANSTTLTLNNVSIENQGIYFLSVTNSVGDAATSAARLLVTTQPDYFSPGWNVAAGEREYLTGPGTDANSSNLERGMAYNRATDHVLVASRIDSPTLRGIYIVDAKTGAHIGQLPVNDLISGGTIVLSRIGVADDGAIYAANFGTLSDTNPLKIYRWANETSEPTIAYSGNPASGVANQQWGKNIDVRGAGTNTQILLDTRTSYVAILTTTDGENFTSNLIQTSAPADAFGAGIAFGAGNTFWGKNLNAPLYHMSFDLNAKTASNLGTHRLISDTLANIDVDVERNLLSGIDISNAQDTVNIYDISNLTRGPVLLDAQPLLSDNANTVLGGNTAIAADRVIVLNTQNGLSAWLVSGNASGPTLTVQKNGANVTVSWPASATGFTLEATTSLTNPNWTAVPTQGNEATVPIEGDAKFFRLRK